MNSIFDENSEFLKYIHKKDNAPKPNPEPQETPAIQPANDPYMLNLKTHQISEPTPTEEVPIKKFNSSTIPTPSSEKLQRLTPSESKYQGPLSFILDKIRFIFISILIFAITFIALNWSAYYTVFQSWLDNQTGENLTSPVAQFSSTNTASTQTSELEYIDNSDIPKLNIEVIPPGYRIVIPRLQSNVPIIGISSNTLITRNWNALEKELQQALKQGVVHYPGTPLPNQSGNKVLTGHSSYYPWDPGRFKDVFAILHQAAVGDEIILFHDQKKYTYQVTEIKKVLPSEVNVLGDMGDDRLTLITCTPIGTNLRRLIVIASPVT